jgi:hypothetical protein
MGGRWRRPPGNPVFQVEAILSRSMVPILRQMEDKPPELVMALLPSLVRTMLAAFVELMPKERASKPTP